MRGEARNHLGAPRNSSCFAAQSWLREAVVSFAWASFGVLYRSSLHRAVIVIAILLAFIVSGVALFAAGGLVAKYGWEPYARVHKLADKQLRALKATLQGKPSNESLRASSLYRLRLSSSQTSLDRETDKVAFTQLGSGYVIGQRSGGLYFVEHSLDPILEHQTIETRVPTNKKQFTEDNSERPVTVMPLVQFGVKDILLRETADGGIELYASHSFWHSDRRCSTTRVSKLSTTQEALLSGPALTEWTTLLDTAPCLEPGVEHDDLYGDWSFLQSGGRMAFTGDGQLLIILGDHWHDGLAGSDLPQDPESHIGKTVLIDPESGSSRIYSLGHRNPQGLYIDRDGNIFSLEHGPRGGDELNVIVDGANYGWPKVSYGTQYHQFAKWPAPHWGDHEGFDLPLFTWTPAIAPSNLVRVEESSHFPKWDGDLIVASLSNLALHRIRIREDRVVVAERMEIGTRIRDLDQARDGSLALLTEPGDIITIRPLDQEAIASITDPVLRGELLWAQCSGCHSLAPGANQVQGPNLKGIVGSRVARFSDFEYSSVLRELDAVWTEENLDAYLRDPQAFAPGSRMQFTGVKDPRDRAAIIAYLRSQ